MPANLGNSSGHRTGKGQFSFQSQRKTMPKNAQTTTQLHSSYTLANHCPKFSKLGFNSTWTINFQVFKLVLEKAEEPEIKLPTTTGSLKKQESSKKNIYFCFIDYAKAFDCVDHINCGKFWKRWEYQTTWPASWETCMQVSKLLQNWTWNNRLVPNRKRSISRLYIATLLI